MWITCGQICAYMCTFLRKSLIIRAFLHKYIVSDLNGLFCYFIYVVNPLFCLLEFVIFCEKKLQLGITSG